MVTPLNVKITGKRSDTETVTLRLEGGGWKSANTGNSLATYPTACPVCRGERDRNIPAPPIKPKAALAFANDDKVFALVTKIASC